MDLKSQPTALDEKIEMPEPNKEVVIHKGPILLKDLEDQLSGKGVISFVWQPSIGVYFECELDNPKFRQLHKFMISSDLKLIIEDGSEYKCFLTHITGGSNSVTGAFYKMPIIGDKSIDVSQVSFGLPNLRGGFRGDAIQRTINGGLTNTSSRIVLSSDNDEFILDMRHQYTDLLENLKKTGGHLILYNGLYRKKESLSISHHEINAKFESLNTFLSFINGRRISAMFITGEHEDKEYWRDYSFHGMDDYKYSHSVCYHSMRSEVLSSLWEKFCSIWKDQEDRKFLSFAVKWYNEANMIEVSTDTSLIMSQSTLELIYNWWIIDKLNLITNDANTNLSAANKIRLILSYLKISYEIPKELKSLNELNKGNAENLFDGPGAIAHIRNSYVHYSATKSKNIEKLTPGIRVEVVKLSKWYIEMALLRMLDYNGYYQNRWLGKVKVPWA